MWTILAVIGGVIIGAVATVVIGHWLFVRAVGGMFGW